MHNTHCRDLKVLRIDPARQGDFFHLHLEPLAGKWEPGQFVMLRPEDWGRDPVWPRPFSICDQDKDSMSLFIQIVGRGTKRLSQLARGDQVSVWGPLGRGFRVKEDVPTLLLAGGIGLAPFVGLVRRHQRPKNLELLFGHRVPVDCYPMGLFTQRIAAKALRQETEQDIQDFVTIMEYRMSEYAQEGMVLACGPGPFLKAVQRIARATGVKTQLSLENRMACGVGACLGCVAEKQDGGYIQTCTHGPVFWSDDVKL